jgi:Na+/H+ antiporter NhaC
MHKARLILTGILLLGGVVSLVMVSPGAMHFGFLAIIPPLFAILLALTTGEVIPALLGGIWLGSAYLEGGNAVSGLLRTLDQHLVNALADSDHASILLFSLILGGMVGIIGASGGSAGIVAKVSRWAKGPRSGQLAAWLLGIIIFFDDYANTLIVGNTFRPLTDKLRISREKLSFIVDSTAAPVASIALISTWIGFEVGLIADGLQAAGADVNSGAAYGIFVATIPYRFYPLFLLLLVFLIGLWDRDFGSMLKAEKRCRTTGQVLRPEAKPIAADTSMDFAAADVTERSWIWGIAPIATVILITIFGLYFSGKQQLWIEAESAPLYRIVSAANSFSVLMWASFSGMLCAALLAVLGAGLNLEAVMKAMTAGIKAMTPAAIILILAWSIGGICKELETAKYVVQISGGFLSPRWIPALTFIIAAAISFATGTSWGTLSILMPIVIPLAYQFPLHAGLDGVLSHGIFLGSVGAVLAGSTFGDHTSPISDTTIMSSMASGADHLDHVKTQLPYALVVAGISLLSGYLPAGYDIHPLLSLLAGGILVAMVLRMVGRKAGS